MLTVEQLWDAFIQEERRRVAVAIKNNEILNENLIGKVIKGGKKGKKEHSCSF